MRDAHIGGHGSPFRSLSVIHEAAETKLENTQHQDKDESFDGIDFMNENVPKESSRTPRAPVLNKVTK